MKVLVLGASGGSGHAAVEQLLTRGHDVTVLARQVDAGATTRERLQRVQGDALDMRAVEQAVLGQDAIVVTLGIRENPLRVRLFGPARTRLDVRSAGTHNVIEAMRKHGVRRLVVQTSYGVGATRAKLDFINRLFFRLIHKPQIADTELQNAAVASSDLDWVLVQPVHLTDADDDTAAFVSTEGKTGVMHISRRSVGRFLADAVGDATFLRQTVSLSGSSAAA